MQTNISYIIKEEDDGKTVETIMRKKLGMSAGLLSYLKTNGKIFINGSVCRSIDLCSVGDIVAADVSENLKGIGEIAPLEYDIEILFEDDFVLVVNKPAKMASHPCIGNYENSLANAVVHHWEQKGEFHNYHIVNRLDKDTSGICVIAKNRYAHGILSQQIKNNEFKRSYTAIIHGVPSHNQGSVIAPIKRDTSSIIKHIVSQEGKFAKTNYRVIKTLSDKYCLVDISLETGRTHQIRVHFSHIGHPLLGDWLYGDGDNEKDIIKRHALHAGGVSFLHPADRRPMIFETELPEDMGKLYKNL